jgi:hypothetical protein
MQKIVEASARMSRAALLLFSLLALLAGPAPAQTTTTTVPTVPPISSGTVTVPPAQGPVGAGVVTIPAPVVTVTPIPLPASVLPPVGPSESPASTGETAITLDVSRGIRRVPPARVTVPVGETLLITGPSSSGRAVQWFKDNRALPGATSPLFAIQNVTSADAGTYYVLVIDPLALVFPSQSLILGVGPTDRLLNLSTRGTLAAGSGQSFVAGFVVATPSPTATKRLILRAVGPTLASFGVTNALRAPILRIFDAAGNPCTNGYAYPAVVGGPTYETDLAASLARTGAFPIPASTLDAVVMMPFAPGSYTAQVTSGDNTAGTVLVEIYEVP